MDPTPWIKYQAHHFVDIIGSFENVHGERFVIWRNGHGALFFTGDEVDWEPDVPLYGAEFLWNERERAQVAKILMHAFGDFGEEGLRDPPVTYSPRVEADPDFIKGRQEAGTPALPWNPARPES